MSPFRPRVPKRLSSRNSSESEVESTRPSSHNLSTGRSTVGAPPRSPTNTPDSPKTPHLGLGLEVNFSSSRLVIPYLNRTSAISFEQESIQNAPSPRRSEYQPNPASSLPQQSIPEPNSSRISSELGRRDTRLRHGPAETPALRFNLERRFVGVGPEEQHLAELAGAGRRRKKARNAQTQGRRCAPNIKNKRIRRQILNCFVSGLLLILILTVYLALALTNRNLGQQFHILLILIILITTIFFCHALVRLCMMIVSPPMGGVPHPPPTMVGIIGREGFADPPVPIAVTLARDEEAIGIQTDATKMPPPAYGLWRESVRVDPDRIYWARSQALPLPRDASSRIAAERPASPTSVNRPPSYASENGVNYVLEAEPRSIAPPVDVPLPIHPSQRGTVLVPFS